MSLPSSEDRYYEDYPLGEVIAFGSRTVDEAEIIAFAQQFDPQRFHIDAAGAQAGPFNGLIASGWHTASMTMKMLVEHFISGAAGLPSPGIDELRWTRPVRPGDTLSVRARVLDKRVSNSKPDRGLMTSLIETLNQDGEVVMQFRAMNMVRLRAPAA